MMSIVSRRALRELWDFAEEVETADRVVIHEGLPGPTFEQDLYEYEIAKEQHETFDGFAFYKNPRPLVKAETEDLTQQIFDAAIPYRGVKMCGEFHPDFMLEWKVRDASYRAHICFGCHELRLIGPGKDLLLDIDDSEFHAIEERLWKYSDKRPHSPLSNVNNDWQDFFLAESASLHFGGKHVPEGGATVPLGDGCFRSNEAERLAKEDKDAVAKLLIAKGALKEHTQKKCVFDPDYVLSWHSDGQFNTFLICLTCGEMVGGVDKFDIDSRALSQLKELLEPYSAKLKGRLSK